MSSDILRRAADRLDELAGAATPGPWTCYGDHLLWPSEHGPAANDPVLAMVGEAHQDSAAYIAAMHPEVGKALAAILRIWVADDLLNSPFSLEPECEQMVDLARLILEESA